MSEISTIGLDLAKALLSACLGRQSKGMFFSCTGPMRPAGWC
jgi:hypothetical protein